MSTEWGAEIPVPPGMEEEAPNGVQQPADTSAEEALVSRLIERLASMGVLGSSGMSSAAPESSQPQQQAPPEPGADAQPAEGNSWSADRWGQSWTSSGPWSSHKWTGGWENEWIKGDWKEKEERPYISHLDFPKFDGKKESYPNYQYVVLNLKSQCAPKDYKYLAPKLIANFTGSMQEDARAMELLGQDFLNDDGVEQLLLFLRKRLHITDLNLETEAFEKYFTHLARKKGETLMKYINEEETAYRKLQRVLKTAIDEGQDEFSEDDQATPQATPQKSKFKLPKRLRGWHFLERASIPLREHSGILNQTGGMNIDKLKKVMADSLTEKVLKDIDGRSVSKAPWQSSSKFKGNKFKKRETLHTTVTTSLKKKM